MRTTQTRTCECACSDSFTTTSRILSGRSTRLQLCETILISISRRTCCDEMASCSSFTPKRTLSGRSTTRPAGMPHGACPERPRRHPGIEEAHTDIQLRSPTNPPSTLQVSSPPPCTPPPGRVPACFPGPARTAQAMAWRPAPSRLRLGPFSVPAGALRGRSGEGAAGLRVRSGARSPRPSRRARRTSQTQEGDLWRPHNLDSPGEPTARQIKSSMLLPWRLALWRPAPSAAVQALRNCRGAGPSEHFRTSAVGAADCRYGAGPCPWSAFGPSRATSGCAAGCFRRHELAAVPR